MNYEDEKTTLGLDIAAFIIALLYLIGLVILYNDYLDGTFGIGIMILCSILFLIGMITFVYVGIANIINSKYNQKLAKKIKDNGVKVKGIVKSIETCEKPNYKNSLFKRATYFRRKTLHLGERTIDKYH